MYNKLCCNVSVLKHLKRKSKHYKLLVNFLDAVYFELFSVFLQKLPYPLPVSLQSFVQCRTRNATGIVLHLSPSCWDILSVEKCKVCNIEVKNVILFFISHFLLSTTYQTESTLVAEVHSRFYIFLTNEFLSQRQLKSITKFLVFHSLIKGSCLSQTRQGWVRFFSSLFQQN